MHISFKPADMRVVLECDLLRFQRRDDRIQLAADIPDDGVAAVAARQVGSVDDQPGGAGAEDEHALF